MSELDAWVQKRGSAKYIPNEDSIELANYGLPENYGIQQVRDEIAEFVDILLKNKTGSMLEVGLGYFGSTHFLWRLIFNHAATIEKNHPRILMFGENTRAHYGKWILDDGRSSFFFGYSNEVPVVEKVYSSFKDGVDAIFLDGDHSYKGILADWLLYAPLVKSGGIVAFHDIGLYYDRDRGPKGFVDDLEGGKINQGKKLAINRIMHSRYHGIGYYVKE